jgi:hypothetical protein
MATVRLKHVNAFRDRHGRLRHYLRLPGRKSISLPGLPGSPEFMSAYSAALDGVTPETRQAHGAGTVSATILAYLRSAAFHDLAKDSQRSRRNCLEQFAADHGDKRITLLEPKHVRLLIEAKRETPGSAHALMSSLSVLMAFAVDTGLRQDNPTLGIKRPKLRGEGFKTWSEADIAQFENRHPVGKRALPMVCRHTVCARRRLGVLLRVDAPRIKSQPLPDTRRCERSSATPKPLPKSRWLGKRCRP